MLVRHRRPECAVRCSARLAIFRGVRRRFDVPGEMPLQDGGYGQDERISTAVAVDLNETGAYCIGGPMSRCLPPCLEAAMLSNSNSNVRA